VPGPWPIGQMFGNSTGSAKLPVRLGQQLPGPLAVLRFHRRAVTVAPGRVTGKTVPVTVALTIRFVDSDARTGDAPRSRDASEPGRQRTWQGETIYYLRLSLRIVREKPPGRRKQCDWLDSISESASNG
jgi:hypothetical protein